MAQTGDAPLLWVSVIDLLRQQKFEEAVQQAEDLQAKGRQTGVKATEASAATCLAVARECQRNSQALDALLELGISWGEAALLLAPDAPELPGPWGAAARHLAQATPSAEVRTLSQELGLRWTETMEPRIIGNLVRPPRPSSEEELMKAANTAQKGNKVSGQELLKASVALQELDRRQEAVQSATAAMEVFKQAGNSEGEATALLCKSKVLLGVDNMAALQAASHVLKLFRELGHITGQAVAQHAIAKVQFARRNPDDVWNRAAESLRLLRLLGDRHREVMVLCTATDAAISMGKARQALSYGLDALTRSRKLQDRFLEAKALCLVAQARGICGEPAGVSAAKEALAIYQDLGLKSFQLKALEALAAVGKGTQSGVEAMTEAEALAASFQAAAMTKEQAECFYLMAKMFHELQDLDNALVATQEALKHSPEEGHGKLLSLLSTILLDRKEFQEALDTARKATENLGLALDDEQKDQQLVCINNQALALAQLGNFPEALQFLEERLREFRAAKEKRGEGQALFIMAQLLQAKGSTEEALHRLALAAPALLESRDVRCEAQAWQLSAKIHLEKNELSKALPAAERSARGFQAVGDRRGRAQLAAMLAEIQFSLCGLEKADGNLHEALRAAKESVSLYHDLNEKSVEMGYSLHCLANINLALHNWEAALEAAQEALELFRSLQLPLLETNALHLESGAYLGAKDFENSRQRALEEKEIYSSAGVLKGVDQVDQWLLYVDRCSSDEQTLKSFYGFSMRRKSNAPVAQSDERQAFRAPRRLTAMNDIELWMADTSKATRSCVIAYQGLEHRSAGGGQAAPAGKTKVTAGELQSLQFPGGSELDHDIRWVHRRKSKSHSKGRRLQKAEEERLHAPAVQ